MVNKKHQVLKLGFVRVVDTMGDESSIVQAARVSYGAGTKTKREDEGLIRYLMKNHHTTPFEMCEIKFHISCPMDVWRQWIRHRTASVNEYSTRYSEAIDMMEYVNETEWRLQSDKNKQGSGGYLNPSDGEYLSRRQAEFQKFAREIYKERLQLGVAREQARMDLLLSTYTEAYWKIDLHNLLHFLKLRMDSHAQLEIRRFAWEIGDIVGEWVPTVWKIFLEVTRNENIFNIFERP